MERIKKYVTEWDVIRIFKLVFGGAMVMGYYSTKESIYLFGAIMFLTQAVFNIGCAGGSCSTNVKKPDQPIIKVDKYEPKKQ